MLFHCLQNIRQMCVLIDLTVMATEEIITLCATDQNISASDLISIS